MAKYTERKIKTTARTKKDREQRAIGEMRGETHTHPHTYPHTHTHTHAPTYTQRESERERERESERERACNGFAARLLNILQK